MVAAEVSEIPRQFSWQTGVQVGSRGDDPQARDALRKRLAAMLKGGGKQMTHKRVMHSASSLPRC